MDELSRVRNTTTSLKKEEKSQSRQTQRADEAGLEKTGYNKGKT
jgi:hypothetical protein